MINKSKEVLFKNIPEAEKILTKVMEEMIEQEKEGKITINTVEELIGKAISEFTSILLGMSGELLSNIEVEKKDRHCITCGRKMVITSSEARTNILSIFGHIPIERENVFCRRCHEGYGVIDKMLEIYKGHRMTKGMVEVITYLSQLVPSFERASEALKKLIKVEVSSTQMQIISEEVGKQVYDKEMDKAQKAYEKPEETVAQELPKDRKEGVLYILTDGLQVNTRIEDEKGTTWKEMKIGLVFYDKDVIKRANNSHKITKKEYVTYFGRVNEFKKLIFASAARAGYGKIKDVVVIGDGAQWIWNICEELFPDAVQILDYYHLSENVNDYAKYLYPEDEFSRKRWVKKVMESVEDGRVSDAIKFVKKYKVDELPDTVRDLNTYITNNKNRIDYRTYKDKGYYIGSGAIESAAKNVIQQRMKQSGMRWSINGGQYIAALRAKHESNLWDDVVKVINL